VPRAALKKKDRKKAYRISQTHRRMRKAILLSAFARLLSRTEEGHGKNRPVEGVVPEFLKAVAEGGRGKKIVPTIFLPPKKRE